MKRIFLFSAILFLSFALWASPALSDLFEGFSQETLEKLKSGTTLKAVTSDGESISALAPKGSQGMTIAKMRESKTEGFAVAEVSFIPYTEKFLSMSEEQRQVETYNILRSISTQKGLTYISHLAGDKPTVLFEDSYMISNPKNKNSRTEDPVSEEVPETYSCYAYQKDNRFGKNVYSINYTIDGGDFLMGITNYTAMKYMGFSCVDEGALTMYLEVVRADEGFVLYTMAEVANRDPEVRILFITVDLPSAFMRRITALKNWFTERVNQ